MSNSKTQCNARARFLEHAPRHDKSGFSRAVRLLTGVVLVSASLSVDCRRLTAEPAKTHGIAPRPKAFEAEETIYDSGLKPGWQDWGWGTHDLSQGPAKLNLSNYGGWILHHDSLSKGFGGLVFRMHAPAAAGQH